MAQSHTVVYTPASQVRSPARLLASIWQDVRVSRELSWRLFVRDVSAQYRQSLLGVVWTFVPPLVTSLIFVLLRSRNVVDFGQIDVPYPVYVMVGTILWQLFVESLNAPLKALTAAKPMLAKINFPRESLIIAAFYTVLYGLLIKLVVIVAVLLAFRVPLTWMFPLGILPMVILVLLGFCVGIILTPLGMLYTDIATALPVSTQLFFFVTPVVYAVPTSFPFSLIGVLNPVSPPLMVARDLITKGAAPNLDAFILLSCITLIGLVGGLVFYRLSLPIVIERISA